MAPAYLTVPPIKDGSIHKRIEQFEHDFIKGFVGTHRPATCDDSSILMVADSHHFQNRAIHGLAPHLRVAGQLSNMRFYKMDASFFRPTEDAARIDSEEFHRAIVGATNFFEASISRAGYAYIDGSRLVAVTGAAVFEAPLSIPALAEAMQGAYLTMTHSNLRAFATALVASKFRQDHGIDADGATVSVRVDSSNGFIMYLQTPTMSVTWEAAIRFRRVLRDEPLADLLTHQPTVIGSINTGSLLRAYRSSIKGLPESKKKELGKETGRTVDEAFNYTALFAGGSSVSVARVACDAITTPDVAEWPFRPVTRASVTSDAPVWRIIDGALLSMLPHVGETVHFGFSPNEGPVSFWTDDGIRIAAAAASARVVP